MTPMESVVQQVIDNGQDKGKYEIIEVQHHHYIPMVRIPRFNLSDCWVGWPAVTFPAFRGENGNIYDELLISQFPFPCDPRVHAESNISFDQARSLAKGFGSNFHLLTAWEWAAMAWYYRAVWGFETGITQTGAPVENGWGSLMYRLPRKWWGVWGVNGNLFEYCDGLHTRDGKIYGSIDNDVTKNTSASSMDTSIWVELGSVINDVSDWSDERLDHENSPRMMGNTLQQLLLVNPMTGGTLPSGNGFYQKGAANTPQALERGGSHLSNDSSVGLAAYRMVHGNSTQVADASFRVACLR